MNFFTTAKYWQKLPPHPPPPPPPKLWVARGLCCDGKKPMVSGDYIYFTKVGLGVVWDVVTCQTICFQLNVFIDIHALGWNDFLRKTNWTHVMLYQTAL